jgi:hypothetical protein
MSMSMQMKEAPTMHAVDLMSEHTQTPIMGSLLDIELTQAAQSGHDPTPVIVR